MVATTLVNRQIEEGEKLLKLLDKTNVRFDVALWMLIPDTEDWRLLLATTGVNQHGTRKIYELIQSVLRQTTSNLLLSEISVVDSSSDLCNSLRNSVQSLDVLTPMSFFGNFIDGQRFPDSIIYRVQ